MQIQRVNNVYPTFCADKQTIDNNGEYSDPLMHWPLRGAAFTNEVGEALRPLIGNYATLSWAPALLYIGADIYDKYKNNQTEYSPNSERCLKQAVFQGMASILLPLVAVKTGQNLFSQLGRFSKSKLTVNAKEHINKLAKQFVENGNMHKYSSQDEVCRHDFVEIVKNNLDYKKKNPKNFVQKTMYYIGDKLEKCTKTNKQKDVEKYAENEISTLIQMRKNLLNSTSEVKKEKYYKNYRIARDNGQTKNVAIKSTLIKSLDSETLRGNFIKTFGGFTALGLAIQPIDHFVENVLIDKVINNGIEKYRKNITRKQNVAE